MESTTNPLGTRTTAMKWWNEMVLEEKFYKTIKWNQLIMGDTTRHPDSLTGREIEIIYLKEKKYENTIGN